MQSGGLPSAVREQFTNRSVIEISSWAEPAPVWPCVAAEPYRRLVLVAVVTKAAANSASKPWGSFGVVPKASVAAGD